MEQTVGATGSFDRWYRAEHPRVLGLLTVVAGDADLAREATAEAFTRALERWERVGAMESPAAWTYRVGVNLLRRRMRRAAFERGLLPDPPRPPAPPAIDSGLWAAVRALPARQRTAVGLRYVCDLPIDEIAAVMGVATGTVSATLTSARRRLAADLAHQDCEPAEVTGD